MNSVQNLGQGVFNYTAIQTANFPNASLNSNSPGGQFEGCSSLTSAKLGGNAAYLPEEMFKDCYQLADLYLGYGSLGVASSVVTVGQDALATGGSGTLTVHVKSGKLADYQADAGWAQVIAAAAEEGLTIVFAGDYS